MLSKNAAQSSTRLFILLSCLVSIDVSENVFYPDMWHSGSDYDVNITAESTRTYYKQND